MPQGLGPRVDAPGGDPQFPGHLRIGRYVDAAHGDLVDLGQTLGDRGVGQLGGELAGADRVDQPRLPQPGLLLMQEVAVAQARQVC